MYEKEGKTSTHIAGVGYRLAKGIVLVNPFSGKPEELGTGGAAKASWSTVAV
jgi:hypothetical protein